MSASSADPCADPAQKLLTIQQGLDRVLQSIETVAGNEQLSLGSALGRILADSVVTRIDVPPFDNSAMDGYAVRSQDCSGTETVVLRVAGASFAGAPFDGEVSAGECVRIMTGAVIPGGADAVVMQEQIAREQDKISLRGDVVQKGLNVRYAGEDMRRGETILDRGTKLGPAEIGLLASTGFNEVAVTRKLRVAFFSTGDELSSIGMPLSHGRIYDSNRYTLSCMLSEPGIECYDLGIVRDQREAVRSALTQASEVADLILTSGGVSVGEADFVTETLRELGEINFWRMAIKPGKPLAFGRMNNAWFFGLPGNPVSTMVTFYQFVLPAIRKMAGAQMREPFLIQARCAGNLNKQAGRMEFQRGILKREADGSWIVSTTGLQDSHVLSSMSKANCFVLLAAESTGANDGDLVTVQPFVDFCA